PAGTSEQVEVGDDSAGAAEGYRLTGLASGTGVFTLSGWMQQLAPSGTSKVYGLGTPILQLASLSTDAAWTLRSDTDTLAAQVTEARLWPRETPTSDTGACRYWGIQLETGAYVSPFHAGTCEPGSLFAPTEALIRDGFYRLRLTCWPGYANGETAADHNLIYLDDDNRLYFRQSDQKMVFVVAGDALESSALTFSRWQELTITIEHSTNRRRLIVSGATSGDGTTSGDPLPAL